jgi:hypothetical protein
MDAKQFDELIARLAEGPTRRNALKGVLGGALASIGVGAIAESDAEAKGNGKGKGRGKNNGNGKGKNNNGKGKGKDNNGGGGGGNGGANDEKKGRKNKNKNKKRTICHCPDGNPDNCVTIRVKKKAAKKHLRNHPNDSGGPCFVS